MSATVTSELAEPEAPRRRSARRWWLVAVVVAILVGLGVIAWQWRDSDQELPGGYGIKLERRVGEPVWTSLVHSGGEGAEEVTITGIEPRVRDDSAQATIEYLICVLDPEVLAAEGVGGFGYGMHGGALDRYCSSTRSAIGSTFRLRSEPPEELIVGVTPTRPGRTVVTGHEISFDVGWQRGDYLNGVSIHVRAPRPPG